MYFWKTKELAKKIKNSELSETNKKNYYLGGTIFLYLSMYLMFAQPRTNIYILLLEAALMLLITIFGISISFKSNGGNTGTDYIYRMVIVSFPISIKLFLLSLPLGFVVGIVVGVLSLPINYIELSTSTLMIFIQILFFWRINAAIKFINT